MSDIRQSILFITKGWHTVKKPGFHMIMFSLGYINAGHFAIRSCGASLRLYGNNAYGTPTLENPL